LICKNKEAASGPIDMAQDELGVNIAICWPNTARLTKGNGQKIIPM